MNWYYETVIRNFPIAKWALLENMEMVASQQELWEIPTPKPKKNKHFARSMRKHISRMLIKLAQAISCEEDLQTLSQATL